MYLYKLAKYSHFNESKLEGIKTGMSRRKLPGISWAQS